MREAAFVLIIGPTFGDNGALLIALAFRITTTFGDVLFFASSFIIRPREDES